MSEQQCQAPQVPQIPVKQDLRKVMTPEKLERLRLARETRARNRIAKEEKRMELAKQMILASVNPGPGMSTQTIKILEEKKSAEEKKLKWEARKDALIQEMLQKIGEMEKSKEPVPESETESEFSDIEETPAKRPKKEKKPSKSKPAVPKLKTKAKRPSSSMAVNTSDRGAKRKPVKPAVMSESESTDDSSETSEVEQEHVLRLW